MLTKKEWRETRQTCLACSQEMEEVAGSITFTFEDYTITVDNVPMKRCPNCVDEYIPGPVAEEVGELVLGITELLARERERQQLQESQTDAISIHYRGRQSTTRMAFA